LLGGVIVLDQPVGMAVAVLDTLITTAFGKQFGKPPSAFLQDR